MNEFISIGEAAGKVVGRLRAQFVPQELPDHPHFKNLTGHRYDRLFVMGYAGRVGKSHAFLCRCDCGNEIITRGYCLTGGMTRSCGCLLPDKNRQIRTTHGLAKSPEWRVWAGMKNRCLNPNVKGYDRYGGRGINVCDRWVNGDGLKGGFECWLEDMGPRPTYRHQIDRIDNNGDYAPGNCRWATRSIQVRNTRLTRRITFNGSTFTAWEWEPITGVRAVEILKRLRRGWAVERALTQPMRGRAA